MVTPILIALGTNIGGGLVGALINCLFNRHTTRKTTKQQTEHLEKTLDEKFEDFVRIVIPPNPIAEPYSEPQQNTDTAMPTPSEDGYRKPEATKNLYV
jgi:hypothetical protein